MSSFHGSINCDTPNEYLDYWDGNVDSKDYKINCSIKNVILRGCTLKNTEYVYGVVIYVGNDTKIMQNSKKPLRKVTNMMKMMNKILYSVFAFQICLVLLFAGLSLAWTQGNAQDHDYLNLDANVSFVTLVVQFFTYWVAYSHMIPISLYVIIELLKLGQAKLIDKDVAMYSQQDYGFASC